MIDENAKPPVPEKTVIRICPACGVVNPAGPSESCPHLQLAEFSGIEGELLALIERVAESRRGFFELLGELKAQVKEAISSGRAQVIAPRQTRLSDVEALTPRIGPPPRLTLENPTPPPAKPTDRPTKKKRARPAHAKVDPRQLELIVRSPPKGHA